MLQLLKLGELMLRREMAWDGTSTWVTWSFDRGESNDQLTQIWLLYESAFHLILQVTLQHCDIEFYLCHLFSNRRDA
jgi:hypothetical protein